MFLYIFVILITVLAFSAYILRSLLDKKVVYKNLLNRHVVITGGSSGIGKAAAIEAAKIGANVTVIGRDVEKLKTTVKEIQECALNDDQKIQYRVLDVTFSFEAIEKCLSSLEADVGPIFMLVNCAGTCVCGQFEKMKVEDIKMMVDLNYFGTAYPTRYVLPGMKERDEGLIVFVSSEAAFIGIYGYSAYSAGKWAVRGLAEALTMELVGTGVRLTLAFPPDTDTPGFEKEEQTKPNETKLISGSGGLHSPDEIGKKLIEDALTGRTYSVFGFSGQILSLLNGGSIDSVSQVFMQVFSMGILRAIMVFMGTRLTVQGNAGLAEALTMELVGTGVRLTLAFPPDTDTPGFEKEEQTKPNETKLISGSGGLHSPDEIGKKLIEDALTGRTYSVFGFSGQILSLLNGGSIDSVSQVFMQVFSMGILRAIMVSIILSFHKIVKDGLVQKKQSEKQKVQ